MLFDCFSFFNELDLLEVRLHELDALVDYFVLVEARRTFQGEPKPLYFADNADRFRRYSGKLIHAVVVNFPRTTPMDWIRNPSMPIGRESTTGAIRSPGVARKASGSDLIIVSDVDEMLSAPH